MNVFTMSLAMVAVAAVGFAQQQQQPIAPNADVRTFLLWENGAPGAQGTADRDMPNLTLFPAYPNQRNGTAVVLAPGGGYTGEAMNHEGRQTANYLNGLGITVFVLRYRLGPTYHHPIELGDAQRAIRTVRARAQEFGVNPERVGIMGYSAGGHLASTAGTHFDAGNPSAADPIDRVGSRPDFLILGYPVITMTTPYTHMGSRTALLGQNPDPQLIEELSNELHVTKETPPTFLLSTTADTTVPVQNSISFYLALKQAGVPAELHVFEKGPHGVGPDLLDPGVGQWPVLLGAWLRGRGLLTR